MAEPRPKRVHARLDALWAGARKSALLEHDPEKWVPVFGKRSCSTNKLERDDDSKKSHLALAETRGSPATLGRVVEIAPTAELFRAPNHPYTQALLANVPRLEGRKRRFEAIKGEIPSPLNPPSGCHFHPRCPFAFARCRTERPALKEIAPGRWSACHLNDVTAG